MRAAVCLYGVHPSSRRMDVDGRDVVHVRPGLPSPLSPGDHVELDGDPVRWYAVVSCSRRRGGGPPGTLPLWDLVLRSTDPGERLAWEVMSS